VIVLDTDPAKAKEQLEKIEKDLNEAKTQRETAERDLQTKKDAEDAAVKAKQKSDLEAKGDYTTLKAQAEAELASLASRRVEDQIDNALLRESIKAKLKSDKYLTLVDRSAIKVENGQVVGADKAFDALKKGSPELFEVEGDTIASSERTPGHVVESKFVDDLIKKTNANRKPRIPTGWPVTV